jgi:hypothetical protein
VRADALREHVRLTQRPESLLKKAAIDIEIERSMLEW